MKYERLNDEEFERVLEAFGRSLLCKPGVDSVVIRWTDKCSGPEIDALVETLYDAFSALTPAGHCMYAVDPHHPDYSFRFDPHQDIRGMPQHILTDGDDSFFVNETMDMGTYAENWPDRLCVFGKELIEYVEKRIPGIWDRRERGFFSNLSSIVKGRKM